jgi:hypothetical protein
MGESQMTEEEILELQRMPVSLYVEQWERLFEFSDEIRRFAQEHEGELKRKAK